MSVNRENVTWQRADGTWAIGFWGFEYTGDPGGEDFDPEWDVDYRDDEFWYFSAGHPSPEAAMDAYCEREANPGGSSEYAQEPEYKADIDRFEAIAQACAARPRY